MPSNIVDKGYIISKNGVEETEDFDRPTPSNEVFIKMRVYLDPDKFGYKIGKIEYFLRVMNSAKVKKQTYFWVALPMDRNTAEEPVLLQTFITDAMDYLIESLQKAKEAIGIWGISLHEELDLTILELD